MQKIKDGKGVMRTPALFATMWKLTVDEESKNDEGEMRTWYNWAVEKVGLVQDKSLFMEAKAFRESVMKGEAKALQEEAPVSDSAPAAQMPTDEDIPF